MMHFSLAPDMNENSIFGRKEIGQNVFIDAL